MKQISLVKWKERFITHGYSESERKKGKWVWSIQLNTVSDVGVFWVTMVLWLLLNYLLNYFFIAPLFVQHTCNYVVNVDDDVDIADEGGDAYTISPFKQTYNDKNDTISINTHVIVVCILNLRSFNILYLYG